MEIKIENTSEAKLFAGWGTDEVGDSNPFPAGIGEVDDSNPFPAGLPDPVHTGHVRNEAVKLDRGTGLTVDHLLGVKQDGYVELVSAYNVTDAAVRNDVLGGFKYSLNFDKAVDVYCDEVLVSNPLLDPPIPFANCNSLLLVSNFTTLCPFAIDMLSTIGLRNAL